MSVMLETSLGMLTIDLHVKACPNACKNFLKLCKVKYYNNVLLFNVQRNFIVQTGDPTGTGKGGSSVYGLVYGPQARYFEDEITPSLRHTRMGVVGMSQGAGGKDSNGSQFYITLKDDVDFLDNKHTIFGYVAEGEEVLRALNEVYADKDGRPLQDVRIKHTFVLDDPFDDPAGLEVPGSPVAVRPAEERVPERIRDDEDAADPFDSMTTEEVDEARRKELARSQAETLEILGDLPDANVKPPENILFVCKLNAHTQDEDLEIIFSRFGEIKACDVVRDFKTGDSLQYAFIEFAEEASCEEAFLKMNNVIVDDRR